PRYSVLVVLAFRQRQTEQSAAARLRAPRQEQAFIAVLGESVNLRTMSRVLRSRSHDVQPPTNSPRIDVASPRVEPRRSGARCGPAPLLGWRLAARVRSGRLGPGTDKRLVSRFGGQPVECSARP